MSDELREQTKNIESLRLRAAANLYISQINDLDTLERLQRLVDKRRRELTEKMITNHPKYNQHN
ncbi:hypothetical protein [Limosilactobacillus mucosae]|uniref:hypothetical protein n=1 Tax=Limosilactobacillus mucosae TaxID=97478 RepID=UPI0022E94463|nr:hypothetical protein [Limosilactobacillus mucosae]